MWFVCVVGDCAACVRVWFVCVLWFVVLYVWCVCQCFEVCYILKLLICQRLLEK